MKCKCKCELIRVNFEVIYRVKISAAELVVVQTRRRGSGKLELLRFHALNECSSRLLPHPIILKYRGSRSLVWIFDIYLHQDWLLEGI